MRTNKKYNRNIIIQKYAKIYYFKVAYTKFIITNHKIPNIPLLLDVIYNKNNNNSIEFLKSIIYYNNFFDYI